MPIAFTIPANLNEGNYSLYLNVTDNFNLSKEIKIAEITKRLPRDTTPPNQISNLHSTEITISSITWVWTNPADTDFAENIIYLNGNRLAQTALNYYRAANLASNTSYTISIQTSDWSGNVNQNNITQTTRTKPRSSSSSHSSSVSFGGSNTRAKSDAVGNYDYMPFPDSNYTSTTSNTTIHANTIKNQPSNQTTGWLVLILIGDIILLIILLILIMTQRLVI